MDGLLRGGGGGKGYVGPSQIIRGPANRFFKTLLKSGGEQK